MLSVALFFPLAATSSIVAIEGDVDCPGAEAVSAELARILPPPSTELGDRASVSRREEFLHVTLRTKEDLLVGEREVAAEGTCEEQARAVAVILAAWLTDVHPEFRTPLPPAEPAAPESPPPPPVAPAPPPPPAVLKAPPAPPSKPARLWRWSAGAGAGLELSDAGLTPAFELSLSFAPDAGLGVMAFALLVVPETRELGSGEARTFRWPLGLGPLLRFPAGSVDVELAAGLDLAWLHAQGEDFATLGDADDLAFGAFGTARVTGRWSFARPFVGLTALGWLSPATLTARVPEAEVDLPAIEGVLLVGLTLPP
ncbi:MAG TPA: hypothetical protein VGK73_18600 [Polyangiaceae bacterium]